VDTVNGIELTEAGVPPKILSTRANTLQFHFIASFDVPRTRRQGAARLWPFKHTTSDMTRLQQKRMTFTLANMYNSELAERLKENEILVGGPLRQCCWRSPFRSAQV